MLKNKRKKIVKRVIYSCTLFALLLSACGGSQPAPTATATAVPTNTLIPASIEPPTPSIPMIEMDGVKVPDPKFLNPEFFDLKNPDSPIVQFAMAFGVKPEEVGELSPIAKTSIDGKQFIILTTSDLPVTAAFDETGIPLFIAEQGENKGWAWSKNTLRKMADKAGMPIGSLTFVGDDLPLSIEIAKREFSVFTQINIGWSWRKKKQGNLDFSWSDEQNQFAKTNTMLPIAQHLIWTEDIPDWVKNGNFTNEQFMDLYKQHIRDTMSHYPDVKIWSVVNEAWLINDPNLDFWYTKFGEDYIRMAFETAREVNPSAILCYSDFQNDIPGKRATMNHKIVEMLKEEKLIDGLMMHMRVDGANPPQEEDLVQMMQSYNLPIYISELTVDMTNVNGTKEERNLKQAEIYGSIMRAAIKSDVAASFVMWGIGDSANWLEIDMGKPNADPTIFDDNLNRKPAYYALISALANGENK
jgi:endo-1,4-beta-xylanase